MATEVERTNGSEGSRQPIMLGQAAGESRASKPVPILKVMELELEGLTIKMTFGAAGGKSDGEGEPQIGNGGSG